MRGEKKFSLAIAKTNEDILMLYCISCNLNCFSGYWTGISFECNTDLT